MYVVESAQHTRCHKCVKVCHLLVVVLLVVVLLVVVLLVVVFVVVVFVVSLRVLASKHIATTVHIVTEANTPPKIVVFECHS